MPEWKMNVTENWSDALEYIKQKESRVKLKVNGKHREDKRKRYEITNHTRQKQPSTGHI